MKPFGTQSDSPSVAAQSPVPIQLFNSNEIQDGHIQAHDCSGVGSSEMLRHDSGATTAIHSGATLAGNTATEGSSKTLGHKDGLDESVGQLPQSAATCENDSRSEKGTESEVESEDVENANQTTATLFRCSICGELVEEDQLDHHVKVCPDPDRGTSSDGSRSPDRSSAPSPGEEMLMRGPSEGRALPALPEGEDEKTERPQLTNIERRHGEARERMDQKQKRLQEDLLKRESSDCTFKPKINKGKHAQKSRRPFQQEVKMHELEKRKHIMELESDIYREATHKPKISRFAQIWSETCEERRDPADDELVPSVFDRLYALSRLRNSEASSNVSPRSTRGLLNDHPAPTDEDLTFQPQLYSSSLIKTQRSAPTAELLYIDAMDRQQRQRVNEAHRDEMLDRERRVACQVLPKSRQYYWQMLEKQVRLAFEAASGGEDTLSYLYLETFLVKLGCCQPAKTYEQDQHSTETSRKLRLALWRHLDPDRKGSVDLLTLTVFFHILMGAVDDPHMAHAATAANDKGSAHRLDLAHQPDPAIKDEKHSAPSSKDLEVIGMDVGMDLEAIIEEPGEEEHLVEESRGNHFPPHGGARVDPSAECVRHQPQGQPPGTGINKDEEGDRISELLGRFDPGRLRAEFRVLYLNRLHAAPSKAAELLSSSLEPVPMPEIDQQSRIMAERVVTKQREVAQSEGNAVLSYEELLLWRREKTLQKHNAKKLEQSRKEFESCTFQPNTSGSALPRRAAAQVHNNSTNAKFEALYAQALAQQQKQKELEQRERECRTYKEMEQCTFRPNTQCSRKSYKEAHQHNGIERHPPPRGFDPCVSRMRRAAKEKERRRFEIDGNPYDAVEGRDYQAVMADLKKKKPFRLRTAERAVRSQHSRVPWETGSHWAASPSFANPRLRDGTSDDGHPLSPRSGPEEQAALTPRGGSPRGRVLGPHRSELAAEGGTAGAQGSTVAGVSSPRSESERQSSSGSPAVSPKHVQHESAGSPGSVKSGGGGASASGSPKGKNSNSTDDVLLFVDVSISPGNTQRLTVLKGQSAAHAAAEFAARHALSEHLAHKLHHLLSEQMRALKAT